MALLFFPLPLSRRGTAGMFHVQFLFYSDAVVPSTFDLLLLYLPDRTELQVGIITWLSCFTIMSGLNSLYSPAEHINITTSAASCRAASAPKCY